MVPIGRPIANARIYILDANRAPVPVGVAGELYIGGAGVARGYLNHPELTAERFIASPFVAGDRLYKTGDLARYLPDGNIEYLGRNDFQVKIRGFRIELGEIEARLSEFPAVRDAVVLAREDVPGEKRLVAYYTTRDGEEVGVEALRSHLLAALPEYMVPAAYVHLESLPLTANGKLDRKALPAPDGSAYAVHVYEPPVGAVEEAIARIWSELLNVERIGRNDNFFDLGGHSLLAVRVLSRLRQVCNADVNLTRALRASDAARVGAGDRKHELTASVPAMYRRRSRSAVSTVVCAAAAVVLGATGRRQRSVSHSVGVAAARRAGSRGAAQGIGCAGCAPRAVAHDVRSRGRRAGAMHRRRRSVASCCSNTICAVVAMSTPNWRGCGRKRRQRHLIFEAGPLIRGRLIRVAESEHVLLITMHHIVSDGWSMGVLLREFSALYRGYRENRPAVLASLEIQYADYAAWQREHLGGAVLQEQIAYWRAALAGIPEVHQIPTDRARPAQQDFAGEFVRVEIDAELTGKLKALSRARGTTLFTTLLAAWGLVLARLSGQDDVVVGTPVANRTRTEIEGLIGFFVNTLALRVHVSGA